MKVLLLGASILAFATGLGLCGCDGTAAASQQFTPPPLPKDWLYPVLDRKLAEYQDAGYSVPDEKQVLEFIDLLETSELGGRTGSMATRDLQSRPARDRIGGLLGVLEKLDSPVLARRTAYQWLAAEAHIAMLPRLILRLKYEKDWLNNVYLAGLLLKLENGAGLTALVNILQADDGSVETARGAAAALLKELPPNSTWQPGADFTKDWQRLLEVEQYWLRYRRLTADAEQHFDRDLDAEIWRSVGRMDSQRLRPVDDSRFVLSRMGVEAIEILTQAVRDEDQYVREACLQTLAWIGYAVGEHAFWTSYSFVENVAPTLGEPRSRARVLEALGASGLITAVPYCLTWLQHGNVEVRTAAADALLKCATHRHLAEVQTLVDTEIYLSSEAQYALAVLTAELQREKAEPEPPLGLSPSEKQRRDLWRSLREFLPPSDRARLYPKE